MVVILPTLQAGRHLHRQLLAEAGKHGYPALLGPTVTTLRGWLDDRLPCIHGWPVIAEQERRLLLIEALLDAPGLYNGSPWGLASALLKLIDELNLARSAPGRTLDEFFDTLGKAYQLPEDEFQTLEKEAQLVHTVWHAWHDQQRQEQRHDATTAYCLQLTQACQLSPAGLPDFWFLAATPQAACEQSFIHWLQHHRKAQLLIHGPANLPPADRRHDTTTTSPPTTFSRWLDEVFPVTAGNSEPARDLAERAQSFARRVRQSPASDRIAIFCPESAESEAQAIAWQVDNWLADGARDIAIVTDDRRLARRLRALFERRRIHLQDRLGWALSTTRAATVIERLLQVAESDFEHRPLLDLLKSGMLLEDWSDEDREQALLGLQRDIIERENTPRNLSRYRQAHRQRQRRLQQAGLIPPSGDSPLERLLALLDEAFRPLCRLYRSGSSSSSCGADYLAGLSETMSRLGLDQSLSRDQAGSQLLAELATLKQAVGGRNIRFDWPEFRSWLGQSLEAASFQETEAPGEHARQVRLLTLEQTALQRFSHLVIASASKGHLNGHGSGSPFFNDSVRQQLHLTTTDERIRHRLILFRSCLEAAPRLLITAQGMARLSPWVELLDTFHRLAWQTDLMSARLQAWHSRYRACPAPLVRPRRPRPSLPRALVGQTFSASSLQRLIDCPYRYFAADGLALSARDEVREALAKADFGERVHRILQRFHDRHATIDDTEQAEKTLARLARAEFSPDLKNNIGHHGWLERFLAMIPDYIGWQQGRQRQWHIESLECHLRQHDIPGLEIHGRIDRIDRSRQTGKRAIIDYKTGHCASEKQTLPGEAVQLPFYRLLFGDAVDEAIYLSLDKPRVGVPFTLAADELETLSEANRQRMIEMQQQLADGQALPAWGDEESCSYCPMSGLCRKQQWDGLPE